MLFTRTGLLRAEHQHGGQHHHDQRGRQVQDVPRRGTRRAGQGGGQRHAEAAEEAHRVARPANGHRRGTHGVFQQEVPTDDPGEDFADGGVGVAVGAAADRDHGGQFGVAQRHEPAGDPSQHERDHHRGPGIARGGRPGQHEDAGADHRAHAHGADAEQAEGFLQVRPAPVATVPVAVVDGVGDALAREQPAHEGLKTAPSALAMSVGISTVAPRSLFIS